MEVRVHKNLIEVDRTFFSKKPYNIEADDRLYNDNHNFDLHNFNKDEMDKLKKFASKHAQVKSAKSVWKDIVNFQELMESKEVVKTAKARTVQHAWKLLVEYFLRYGERKHVYEREEIGDESVTVCYYVSKIEYNPPIKKRDYNQREFLSMQLVYKELGVTRTSTISFQVEDCLGLTPKQILAKADLMPESESLRADYEEHHSDFLKWFEKVGQQMLAVGTGSDEDVDGNDNETHRWYYDYSTFKLDKDGEPTKVVVDIFEEDDEEDSGSRRKSSKDKDENYVHLFWNRQRYIKYGNMENAEVSEYGEEEGDPEELEEDDTEHLHKIEIPIHPYMICFDMKRHRRIKIHVGNLTEYKYNESIRDFLVLPENNSKLIDVLLSDKEAKFRDVIKGKTGGMIVLCQGPPGTGKTLTAEIYAEVMKRALYTIQCSQLGTDASTLEENLMKILARGRRWNAVTLLDEADVYVRTRGNDLTQNAIVGVFLRVLEYHSGVLFLTTNRGDLVDDAVLSRCTARIPYTVPDITQQHKIWRVLADVNEIPLTNKAIKEIVGEHHKLSGRDIKNLLKLAAMVAHDRGCNINAELIGEMKVFKPTFDQLEEE